MLASNQNKDFAIGEAERTYRLRTFRSSLDAVGLHGHVRIQVVQRAICFFTAIPAALVHPFNLLIAAARSLVLLRTRDRDKRVHLDEDCVSQSSSDKGAHLCGPKNRPKGTIETRGKDRGERERE